MKISVQYTNDYIIYFNFLKNFEFFKEKTFCQAISVMIIEQNYVWNSQIKMNIMMNQENYIELWNIALKIICENDYRWHLWRSF